MASYLDARASGGEWLLRMEDVDKPREQPGAAEGILQTLERFGFEWDGAVLYQSARTEQYRAALERLDVFRCACSRREADQCRCLQGIAPGRTALARRVRAPGSPICFDDRLQGRFCQAPDDFVVLRADGYFAYQLAVVVDDAEQGVTDVVRGSDLLDSTPRQILLQRMLGVPEPRYLHLPVAVNAEGQKLSKQALSPAVGKTSDALRRALVFLGQAPCDSLRAAIGEWRPERIPCVLSLPEDRSSG